MSFIDSRLNSRYRYGFVGGPNWNTLSQELRSGRTRRKKGWAMPHHQYTANYATLNDAEKDELLNAFMAAGGSFLAFRFKDWNDWQAVNQPLGVGSGTTTPIQLTKTYPFGATSFVRTITLPLNAVISGNGTPLTGVTVNPLTGMATRTGGWPLGQVLTWSGQFDVRTRFAADFNPFTSVASNVRECMVELVEDFP